MSGNEFEDRKLNVNQVPDQSDFDDWEFCFIDCEQAFTWTSKPYPPT